MPLIPRYWPTPISAGHPSAVLCQTVDALFAWGYVASFTACLPFFLNPPFWLAALSTLPAADKPSEASPARRAAPEPAPKSAAKPRPAAVLSLVPAGRGR